MSLKAELCARRRRGVSAGAAVALAVAVALLAAPFPHAKGEVAQKGNVRVSVSGKMAPTHLPRGGGAPVAVTIGGEIGATEPGSLPQLQTLTIAINRHGRVDSRGLPLCRMGRIDPSTTEDALAVCRSSLIGEGSFSADVKLPEQSPFPSEGKVLAFNGRFRGEPAILAHIYGTKPVPTSYVLPFLIRASKGTFGTVLEASFPHVTGSWGYVTGVSMTLDRRFTFRGHRRSYLMAGCPAPAGFQGAFFPLVRTSFAFAGGVTLTSTLNRRCKVKG